MVKKILRPVLAAGLVLALTACGSGGSDKSAADSKDAKEVKEVTEASDNGGHMKAALYWFGTSLDPATEYDGWTTSRAGITETLYTVDENYEIVPCLADSFEQKDDTTWVFHIRDGVTFQNGDPVDGEAVKASFERLMKAQERAVTTAKIASVEAEGQNVTFKTSEPFGAFLASISEPMYGIVNVKATKDFASAPIGTGPFMPTSFKVNEVIELQAYEGYWGGKPGLSSVTLKCIEDDATRALAIQSKEIDLMQKVASTDLPTFKDNKDYALYDTLGARIRFIAINRANESLNDSNVRKALANAIDYEALAKILGDGVTVAGAPYPETAPYGYDQLDRQHFDLETAKSLLEKAGAKDTDGDGILEKDGKALSFKLVYDNADYTIMLEAVKEMAKAVGMDLQLSQIDNIASAWETKDFDLFVTNWQTLSTGDPQWYLDSFYKTDSPTNYMNYSNEKLDAIIKELSSTFDIKGREEKTIEAEKCLLEDTASIYLVGEKNYVLANAKVSGVKPYPIDYYFLNSQISMK